MSVPKRYIILSSLLVLLTAVLLICHPKSTNFTLTNGGQVEYKPASFLRSLFPEASTKTSYRPAKGRAGEIVLWQNLFDGPVTVLSSTNQNILLCLYDYDVDYRLFRIDTGETFQPLDTNSDLHHILFRSDWAIRDATDADWQELLNYLKMTTPGDFARHSVSVGTRLGNNPQSILHLLALQHITSNSNK